MVNIAAFFSSLLQKKKIILATVLGGWLKFSHHLICYQTIQWNSYITVFGT